MKTNHPIKKICEYCGKEFEANKRTVRYCSHTCNSKAYNETQRKQVVALTEILTSKKKIEKATHNLSDRPYLNIIEVANLTGVSRWTIYRNVVKGIIPAIRLSRRLTLIRRKDIDTLFDDVEPYEILSTGERKPIEDWYTMNDITEKYGILRHRIRKIINTESIPTKKDGTRTLVAKNKIDNYFKLHPRSWTVNL
jgi:excisionase family DNA binding protein